MIILLGFLSNINAQEEQDIDVNTYTDGFFFDFKFKYRTEYQSEILPMLPDGYNYLFDVDASGPGNEVPLGSGLFIMTGMALAYSIRRKE